MKVVKTFCFVLSILLTQQMCVVRYFRNVYDVTCKLRWQLQNKHNRLLYNIVSYQTVTKFGLKETDDRLFCNLPFGYTITQR